jgi:hypothetical protein
MQLLTRTVELEDTCWEQRLRCGMLVIVEHASQTTVPAAVLGSQSYVTCFQIFLLFSVTQIFLLSVQHVSPIVVQAVTLPCLKILSQFIKPKPATTKANAVSISTLLLYICMSCADLSIFC